MPAIIQIELPSETFAQLEEVARQQQRGVDDIVRAMILHELPGLPPLPEDIEAELAAFERLSDDVLWLLAKNTLTAAQQEELAALNETNQQRDLTALERERQQLLLDAYDRAVIRRAQAAAILKERGHDVRVLTGSHTK
jgi:hypothetical protein